MRATPNRPAASDGAPEPQPLSRKDAPRQCSARMSFNSPCCAASILALSISEEKLVQFSPKAKWRDIKVVKLDLIGVLKNPNSLARQKGTALCVIAWRDASTIGLADYGR